MPAQRRSTPELRLKRSLAESLLKKMAEDNLSISELAARLKTGRTAVRRILDKDNTSITFRSMSRAAEAVGLELRLDAKPMPPEQLGKLSARLSKARNRREKESLMHKITEGFYAGS